MTSPLATTYAALRSIEIRMVHCIGIDTFITDPNLAELDLLTLTNEMQCVKKSLVHTMANDDALYGAFKFIKFSGAQNSYFAFVGPLVVFGKQNSASSLILTSHFVHIKKCKDTSVLNLLDVRIVLRKIKLYRQSIKPARIV